MAGCAKGPIVPDFIAALGGRAHALATGRKRLRRHLARIGPARQRDHARTGPGARSENRLVASERLQAPAPSFITASE